MECELAHWLSDEIDRAVSDYDLGRISMQLKEIRVRVVWERVKREGLFETVANIRLKQFSAVEER